MELQRCARATPARTIHVPFAVSGDPSNSCALDGISSPDNLSYFPDLDVLFIAEDTDYHQNEVAWAYNFREGARVEGQARCCMCCWGASAMAVQ